MTPEIGDRQDPSRHQIGKRVQSVDRALSMLEEIAVSEHPLSTTEVARRAAVNRATAWRLLNTLEHFGYVERDPRSGHFLLGYGPSRIVNASRSPALIRRARPILEQLAADLNESVYLEVASAGKMIVLDEVPSSRPIRAALPNIEIPLHCGSVGKAYLAFLPEPELETFLTQPLQRFTPRTITDPRRLRQALLEARRDHFAWAYQEHLPDWGGATTVACDDGGNPLAYLNVTVPAYRCSKKQLLDTRNPLRHAARELERRLLIDRGWSDSPSGPLAQRQ